MRNVSVYVITVQSLATVLIVSLLSPAFLQLFNLMQLINTATIASMRFKRKTQPVHFQLYAKQMKLTQIHSNRIIYWHTVLCNPKYKCSLYPQSFILQLFLLQQACGDCGEEGIHLKKKKKCRYLRAVMKLFPSSA